ncbi:hypothetical protein Fmac_020819 [Flemingia macrophylla]|uniref:Uncharacterized protein n=1 Tax=Flemingia macrophylla TaxID=520843 RepID=A0ABD1LVB6_9FABA
MCLCRRRCHAPRSIFNNATIVIHFFVLIFIMVASSTKVDSNNLTPFVLYGTHDVIKASVVLFFAYIGFNAASIIAEETKNPAKSGRGRRCRRWWSRSARGRGIREADEAQRGFERPQVGGLVFGDGGGCSRHTWPRQVSAAERDPNAMCNDHKWILYSGSLDKSVKVWKVAENVAVQTNVQPPRLSLDQFPRVSSLRKMGSRRY